MTVKNITVGLLSIVVGIILAIVCNFLILEKIFIPDPCYYHSHATTIIFDLFYDLPASEGFHPFPTSFNFIFTLVIGGLSGLTFFMLKIKKRKKET